MPARCPLGPAASIIKKLDWRKAEAPGTLRPMSLILYTLPETFAAGETIAYRRQLADYPATSWTLTLYIAGAKTLASVAAADGDVHVVTLGAGATAALTAGVYRWAERVDDGAGLIYQVASGVVRVTGDLAQATEGSEQEWVERAIAMLRAHIEGRLPAGLESYQIANRVVSKMPIREAVGLVNDLEARLARLGNPDQISRSVLVQFTGTGYLR